MEANYLQKCYNNSAINWLEKFYSACYNGLRKLW